MADAPALGAGGWPCRFKSCRPHGKSLDFFAVIRYNVYRISNYVYFIIGLSPSGKAQDFDSCITLVRIQLAQLEFTYDWMNKVYSLREYGILAHALSPWWGKAEPSTKSSSWEQSEQELPVPDERMSDITNRIWDISSVGRALDF